MTTVSSAHGWKVAAAALVLVLLTALAAVSSGPGVGFLSSLLASMQCRDDNLVAGGAIPVPAGDPDAKLAFRAASWNVLKSNSVSNVAAGLQKIAGTADVIGLQEFRGKFRGSAIKQALPGWSWSNQNTSVPITWNARKFALVAKDRVLEFDSTRVAGGPVGRSAGPKYAEWVQLRDRQTGASFVVVNHHLLYNIESKGHPDRRVGKKYLSLAQKQMQVERALVTKFSAVDLPVVVTKDGNWDYRKSAKTQDPASPYVQATRVGLYTSWQVRGPPKRGTQSSGTRLIDSISSTTATLIPVQHTILGRPKKRFHGSDHAPPVAALTNAGFSARSSLAKASQVTAVTQKQATQRAAAGGYSDPVTPAVIGAKFGDTGLWARYHTGLDYRAAHGRPIRAVTAGTVVYAGNSGDWAGNHVAVEHADGYTTMSSHMSRIDVTKGQTVQAGTQLGLVGQTGRAFGPHLHFELYPPGVRPGDVYQAVDPQPWLKKLRAKGGTTTSSTARKALNLPIQGRWSGEQRSIAAAFTVVWRERGLPERALEIIMITGLVESEMSSPDEEHSDRDSAGPLQQRPHYGTEAQRRDPFYAAGKFFDRLVRMPSWRTRPQGDVAQDVQISDFPDRYQQRLDDARDLIASVANVTTETTPDSGPGNCGDTGLTTTSTTNDTTQAAGRRTITEPSTGITYTIPIPAGPAGTAINFALDQLGEPYVFGSQGPDTWDCSGLVSKAWKAAGVDVYPQTEVLVKDLPAVTTPQPGDLLYKPGHVQMFLMDLPDGKQLIVEAPRTGKNVQVVTQWMNVTRVLRPGG